MCSSPEMPVWILVVVLFLPGEPGRITVITAIIDGITPCGGIQFKFSFIKVNLPERIIRYQSQFYNSGFLYPDLADLVSKPFN
jgi:hypothetical protein